MALHDGKSIGEDRSEAALGGVVLGRGLGQRSKRILDIAAATVILICYAPILLIASVAIKLDSRGPISIRETRHGDKNRAKQVFKFRLTTACAEGDRSNRRLTRVGRILWQTGIDELPQFINVLRGEISFIDALHAARKGSPDRET
jgi:lipopolysaccharide/colanic/teichoic acid biosynthesis glycosyltransferase